MMISLPGAGGFKSQMVAQKFDQLPRARVIMNLQEEPTTAFLLNQHNS